MRDRDPETSFPGTFLGHDPGARVGVDGTVAGRVDGAGAAAGRVGGAGASVDGAVAVLASRQHCVFGLDQLVALGLSESAVRTRAARSRLHRIHHGVYSLVPRQLLAREGHWMAAVLACGPGAALSHRNAAALHEIRGSQRAKIDVSVPHRGGHFRPGLDVHHTTTLTAVDITVVKGIPCTSVARTLLDLAEVVPRRQLERACDQTEVIGTFDLRAVEDQLDRSPRRRGAHRLRAVLEEHYIGSTATLNDLEEGFLAICRRVGVPDPQVNEWVDLGDGETPIWADFVWRPQRVIVETDGRRVHGTRQARERDPRRDQRAILAGWVPMRTTWRQVMRRPYELERILPGLVRP
jgi:Transcriptional regulator, AbiEi antitoxin